MLRPLIAAAAMMPLLMGCAALAQAQDRDGRTPEEMALVNATCTKVMGLRKGEEFYLDCRDSLSHSLARRDAAYEMAANDAACRRLGLSPGSAALATCVLDHQPTAANAPLLQPVALSEAIQPGRSYYSVMPDVQTARRRHACAQLGLMPSSGLFGECVGDLDHALQPYSG